MIDGTSQPGSFSRPVIELDGSLLEAGNALDLASGSDGSTIKGLVIGGFPGDAIHVSSGSNHIENNYLGTSVTGGVAHGNNSGVQIDAGSDNTIGGTSAASRNNISGNGMGIYLSGGVDGTTITGNYIGLDVSGSSAIPNADGGVIAYSNDNTITGNVSSANSRNIQIIGTAEGGGQNVISGNLIGTDAAGTAALGNSGGIVISDGAHDNVVGGLGGASTRNVISGTRGVGVTIDGADNNTVLGNSSVPMRTAAAVSQS